jgi:hypothetical protein
MPKRVVLHENALDHCSTFADFVSEVSSLKGLILPYTSPSSVVLVASQSSAAAP